MNRKAGWAATAAFIAAGATYQYLIYSAAHGSLPPWLRLSLKALPLLLLAWWISARATHKPLGYCAVLALAVLLYWADGKSFGSFAYGVPHAVIYLSLAWLFGHTLTRGRQPLITGLALRVHGELAPEMVLYTRHVTLAWTLFCLAQILLSGLLYCYASLDAWSLFITVLNVPLLALMFGLEYLVRVLCFPDHPQASIAQAIRAFNEHTQQAPAREVDGAGLNGSAR